MVPRQVSGIWWTRWANLDDHDVRQLVEDYETHALPMDVFILDMDWHTKQVTPHRQEHFFFSALRLTHLMLGLL